MNELLRPADIPTAQTVAFIQRHIDPGSHIVEVGCGDGEVALALARKEYEVTALDSDPERVAKAMELGVHAVVALWPKFDIAPVDAIAFTRSLHHINPLPEAIDRARLLLKADGVLLIEDFAVESMTQETLNWFKELVRSEPFSSVLESIPESFVAQVVGANDPMQVWEQHHTAHGVHQFALMHQAITDRFAQSRVHSVPYLYRYLASVVPETNESTTLVRKFLRDEIRAAETNRITAVGRRIVAWNQRH